LNPIVTDTIDLDSPDDIALADRMKTGRERIVAELRKAIVGQDEVLGQVLLTLFVGGNSLIVGVPGLAKTLLIHTLARVLDLKFSRIQFTPDLMPSDITGTDLIQEDPTTGRRQMVFAPGPIFANIVLADEINRTPPKTQSALLEAMQEHRVTIQGRTYQLDEPFYVFATQNPIELEGTYPLPEAQLDRFMLRLGLGYPQPIEEIMILDEQKRTHPLDELGEVLSVDELREMQDAIREIYVDSTISDYIVRLVNTTRSHPDVYLGASPRGSIALYRAGQALAGLLGRDYVIPDDIKVLAEPALAHRLIIKTSSTIHDVQAGQVVRELLETTSIENIHPTGQAGGPRDLRAPATKAPSA
jgi:MoxR-like ATPase